MIFQSEFVNLTTNLFSALESVSFLADELWEKRKTDMEVRALVDDDE